MKGDDIRRMREARGLTQAELAARLGVGQRTVGNWERGETVPRNRIGMLRAYFGLDDESANPLLSVSDIAMLTELLRRAAAREPSNSGTHG